MTITKLIRIIFFSIFVIIDSIIYFIPIFTLCLIPNFVITIIWYLPSIYQLYSFIFTKKKVDLRIKIYLFLLSPLIIILYIPLCIIIFIGYSINITLIRRLITIFLRPEYPISSFSSTVSLIYLIYQYFYDDEEENDENAISLKESIIIETFIQIIKFIKECWNFNSIKISKKIQKYKIKIFEITFYKLINFIDFFTIIIFLIIIIIFWIIFSLIELIIYCCFSLPIQALHDQLEEFLMGHESTLSTIFLKVLIFLIFFPIFYLIGVIYAFFIIFISYIFLWIIETIIEVSSTVIEVYNENGFHNVINYFRLIIIKLILYVDNDIGTGLEALIYNWFGIYIYDCDEYILQKANVVMKIFELSRL